MVEGTNATSTFISKNIILKHEQNFTGCAKRIFNPRKKKTFLLTTILLPLLFFGFYALIIYFSVSTDEKFNIAVNDDANIFKGKIDSDANVHFSFVQHQTAHN